MSPAELKQWLHKELFHQVPINIAVIDPQFNIIEANNSFTETFGDWEGKKCYEVYKGHHAKCADCQAALTFQDGSARVKDELGVDRYGRKTRYILHTAPVKRSDGSIPYVIEMTKDVTELKELQYNYQILFERVPCSVAVLDRDFRVVRANERFRNTFGDRIGDYCYHAYRNREEPCLNCPAVRTFQDGSTQIAEKSGFTKDGKPTRYIVNTAPLGRPEEEVTHVIEMSTDVTELRSLESELEQLYKFQMTLIGNSFDGIIATDQNGKIVVFNPAAEKLLGYTEEEVKRSLPLERVVPKRFVNMIKRKGKTCLLRETFLQTKDNQKIPVRFTGVGLRQNGNFMGSAAFIQDLTVIKRLEAEKLESERLAAVGKTVAGLAHGVKNILTGIEGGMYVMKTGLHDGRVERILSGWDMLERNFEKITVFVKDFLSFSKGEKAHLQMCNPAKITRDVIMLYRDAAEQVGVTLSADIPEVMADVPFDSDGLHACLANLISNAIDACQLSDNEECTVVIHVRENGDRILFEVTDNGCGMDYDVKQKVFTNFFTTKGTKGTGIGLLTTRKIIQQHGGEITMESEVGKGSTFRITVSRKQLLAKLKAQND